MKFATHYAPPPDARLECPEASLTQQEYADECDLNKIMDRYASGMGTLPVHSGTPIFGDFSHLPDYQGALDVVMHARDAFDSLPAKVRDRFGNDPQRLLDFLADAKNKDVAVELGLIDKPAPAPEPMPAPAPAPEAHKQNGGT